MQNRSDEIANKIGKGFQEIFKEASDLIPYLGIIRIFGDERFQDSALGDIQKFFDASDPSDSEMVKLIKQRNVAHFKHLIALIEELKISVEMMAAGKIKAPSEGQMIFHSIINEGPEK